MDRDDIVIKQVFSKPEIKITERLADEIWTEHYTPIIGPQQVGYMLRKYQSEDAISKAIENGYLYCLVFCGGNPCGYFALKEDDGIFLSKFYVKKESRGMGLGRAMIKWLKKRGIQTGTRRIWLTCNKYNEDTLNIYRKMGFEIIDSVVTDIGNGYFMDDYIMEMRADKFQSDLNAVISKN